MSAQKGMAAKVCAVCGVDCTNRPRTKDRHGRYFCRPCYERLLAKARAHAGGQAAPTAVRRAAAAPQPTPAAPLDDLFAGLEGGTAVAVTARPCPGCGAALPSDAALCTTCGYNVRTGRSVAIAATAAATPKTRTAVARSLPGGGFLRSPLVISGLQVLIILGLFAVARTNPGLGAVYATASGAYIFAIQIWVVVVAFGESSGSGLLCLLLPFYALYFVFAKCGNAYLRGAYLVAILSGLLRFAVK